MFFTRKSLCRNEKICKKAAQIIDSLCAMFTRVKFDVIFVKCRARFFAIATTQNRLCSVNS